MVLTVLLVRYARARMTDLSELIRRRLLRLNDLLGVALRG